MINKMLQFLLIFTIFNLTNAVRSSHNQMRRFICEKIDKNGDAICSVILMKMLEENEEEVVKSGVGCFQEIGPINVTRLLCPTYCNGASSAFVISKTPSNNNKCLSQINYHIENREDDWYFYRSEKCLQAEIQFDIGCSFDVFEGAVKVKDFVEKAFKRRTIRRQ